MIKCVLFDYDGVFTDGTVQMDSDKIVKGYNVKDGMGISLLKKHGLNVGVISGYKRNSSQESILNHLGIDIMRFEVKDKMSAVEDICRELNLDINEVAYMGDDTNDIDVMRKVMISACPTDAHAECIRIANFVSNKKGGHGCIRDFCDHIMGNNTKIDPLLMDIKREINYQISEFNITDAKYLSNKILTTNGNVYTMGVGKSGNMASHMSDLLKSLGIKSMFISVNNVLHGDMGIVDRDDIVIMFSNSGNSVELIQLLPHLNKKQCWTIGISCREDCKLSYECKKHIVIQFGGEIGGEISHIPTNSCICQLMFINVVVSIVKRSVNVHNYKDNHPSGNIGESLLTIKDVMTQKYPKVNIKGKTECNMYEVFYQMTDGKMGCCFFVDDNMLVGILTDGDLRRIMLKDNSKRNIIFEKDINKNFKYESDVNKMLTDINLGKIGYIPIIDSGILVGVISNSTC